MSRLRHWGLLLAICVSVTINAALLRARNPERPEAIESTQGAHLQVVENNERDAIDVPQEPLRQEDHVSVPCSTKLLPGIGSGSSLFAISFTLNRRFKTALGISDEEETAFLELARVEADRIIELESQALRAVVDGEEEYYVFPIAPSEREASRKVVVDAARKTMGGEVGDAVEALIPYDDWFGNDHVVRQVSFYDGPSGTGVKLRWLREDGTSSGRGTAANGLRKSSGIFKRYGHILDANLFND